MRVTRWALVGIVGLLIAGCTSPTPLPSSGPLTQEQRVASTVTPEPTLAEEVKKVTFTIVYDNNAYDSALKTAWGFSGLVETGETTVLFDTGGDGPTLLGNMTKLGLDPQAIDAVVLSHIHGDHTGGLAGLLDTGARPTVYVPAAFPASFKADVRARTELVEVGGPIEILPGVCTTGEMGSGIVEQALVVETGAGLVVVTGCAHPGIVDMVRRAQEVTAGEVTWAMGGFHLGGANQWQIKDIIAEFRRLGVQRVAPCHCTGDRARRMLAIAFGPNCTLAGVGWVVSVGRMDRLGGEPKTGLLPKLLAAFRRASGQVNRKMDARTELPRSSVQRLHTPVSAVSCEYGG
jgi:7,8-dihydropterin-6-yl-methyl-4-(beta-D-ribofuranosyl)aminobenzene 5'-phosphate synthase